MIYLKKDEHEKLLTNYKTINDVNRPEHENLQTTKNARTGTNETVPCGINTNTGTNERTETVP